MTFAQTPFAALLLGLDAGIVACALAGALFWRRRRGGFLFGGVLGTLPWLAAGALEGTIWGFALGARAAWTAVTVALPLALLARAARGAGAPPALLAAGLVAFKWWGEAFEPSRLEVERAVIPVAGLKSPVRVAHFSDLQTDGIRAVERRARDEANAFSPDLVLFSGDAMNHPSLEAEVYDWLKGFEARAAKLFVDGDVDGDLDPAEFERRTGFEWIGGRVREVRAGGARLAVLGFSLLDYRRGASFAEELARRGSKADARIALSHRPDAAFALRGLPVSALFTGHTHGGQVVIPGFGPPVTLTRVDRAVAAGGVRPYLGMTVSLARGLGWEGHVAPRVRLFCRPHLILAELVPVKKA
jgi:uncharacterized protein